MKLESVAQYIQQLFNTSDLPLIYHDINHTLLIVKQVEEACQELNITGDEQTSIITAAWFHDTGYLRDYNNHETQSVQIFQEYLQTLDKEIDPRIASTVINCILATEMSCQPKNFLEAILKDIDIAYALYTDFKKEGEKLRVELEKMRDLTFTQSEWDRSQKEFLMKIEFSSEYGQRKFSNLLNKEKEAHH